MTNTQKTIIQINQTSIRTMLKLRNIYKPIMAALEKQTPKNPISTEYAEFACPNCKRKLNENALYCEYCGQALKWGE